MGKIYMDNAAGTRLYPEVIESVTDVLANHWGNASSNNSMGDDARFMIESVRRQIANDINAHPDEIIFTSGACEANALALSVGSEYIITDKLEHASINDNPSCRNKMLPNDNYGFIKPCMHNAMAMIMSVAAANSEIGTIQDIKMLSDLAHSDRNVFHTDATQLYPERRIDVRELGIDMMSVSAQKFHGPRGAGFLYVRYGNRIAPIIYGSQENGLRGGTYNTAAIVGMGKALEITRKNNKSDYVGSLRDQLLYQLMQIPGVHLNGAPVGSNRLKNNINLTIQNVNAERLATMCDMYGLIIGKGSACQSHSNMPSHVLTGIGLTGEQAFNTIRITLDEFNTEEEVYRAADIITRLVGRVRNGVY